MSLSRFLRDSLYLPLGGNRQGKARRYLNVMVTMRLGGLWHVANWTLVFWGGFHGLCIVINHAWHNVRARLGWPVDQERWWGPASAQMLTFFFVVVAWVFSRAETFAAAKRVLGGMAEESLEERVVSSRNRRNPRGVKRKMSNFLLRDRGSKPVPQGDI